MRTFVYIFLLLYSLTCGATDSRPPGWRVVADAGNGWTVDGVWSTIHIVGWGDYNAWFYAYTYMRWPGTNNGNNKSINFRTGFDDIHILKINDEVVTSGDCCSYAYGSYSAKPGDIVKIEFYSYNGGGYDWIYNVSWNPDGSGYSLLGGGDVSYVDSAAGGGSAWYTSEITTQQTTFLTTKRSQISSLPERNSIYLEEKAGSSGSVVFIEQSGNYNAIRGYRENNATLSGVNNTVDIKQGSVSGKNIIEFDIYGSTNTVTLWQSRNISGGVSITSDSGGHYIGLDLTGNTNTAIIKQHNDGGGNSGHFSNIILSGSQNNITVIQRNDGDKKLWSSINGDNNTISVSQLGGGNHYLDLSTLGNNHNVSITQRDNGSHRATINLQNSGGATTLNLTQSGNTSQTYSIAQQCANLSGCSVSVTQGHQ